MLSQLRRNSPEALKDVEIDMDQVNKLIIHDSDWGEVEEDEHVRNLYKVMVQKKSTAKVLTFQHLRCLLPAWPRVVTSKI